MKNKFLALAAVIAIAAAGFTACGNNSGNDADIIVNTAGGASAEDGLDEEFLGDEEIIDDEEMQEEAEIDLDEYFPDLAGDDLIDDETGGGDVDAPSDVSTNPLRPMADRALAEGEWPFMDEVTDPVIISEFFTLDVSNSNYNGLIIMQCPMSASMSEVIIIDAVDVDSAKADLEARRTKAIETDAWYPHDQELAEASIVGTNGSYAYFIIGDSAADAESAINAYISENA